MSTDRHGELTERLIEIEQMLESGNIGAFERLELLKVYAEMYSEARLIHLRLAAAKLDAKLRDRPDDPSASGWKKRLKEYAVSIKNLAEGRAEVPIVGPVGAQIGVPKDTGRVP